MSPLTQLPTNIYCVNGHVTICVYNIKDLLVYGGHTSKLKNVLNVEQEKESIICVRVGLKTLTFGIKPRDVKR